MIDIQYLLLLQNLREATCGVFNEFFNGISKVAVDVIFFLPFVIYWACDTVWGKRLMVSLFSGEFLNGVIKLSVCAYRPWIRSDLIEPAGDSKIAATGYSFPSGHTVHATTIYGTTAIWQWKKRRWLGILCIIGIALTGFSRNFLGVHTPQDVLVGCTESLLLIFFIGKIQDYISDNEKKADLLSAIGTILIAVALIYIKLKPYPMDYIDGKLLVDPQKMMVDCFKFSGALLGFIAGTFLNRKKIRYEIPFAHKNLPVLTSVGTGILFSWKEFFAKATVIPVFGTQWGNLLAFFLMSIFGLIIWPIVIRKNTEQE